MMRPGSKEKRVALMMQGQVIPLDAELSLAEAKLSVETKLPIADSVILATARTFDAILWTQDGDLKELKGVRYVEA